jgi:hypothetical protein
MKSYQERLEVRIRLEKERREVERVREEEKKSQEMLLQVREVVGGDVNKVGDAGVVGKIKEAKETFENAVTQT